MAKKTTTKAKGKAAKPETKTDDINFDESLDSGDSEKEPEESQAPEEPAKSDDTQAPDEPVDLRIQRNTEDISEAFDRINYLTERLENIETDVRSLIKLAKKQREQIRRKIITFKG